MPLRRGEVRGFNFDRIVVEFTMLNQDQGDSVCDQHRSDGRS